MSVSNLVTTLIHYSTNIIQTDLQQFSFHLLSIAIFAPFVKIFYSNCFQRVNKISSASSQISVVFHYLLTCLFFGVREFFLSQIFGYILFLEDSNKDRQEIMGEERKKSDQERTSSQESNSRHLKCNRTTCIRSSFPHSCASGRIIDVISGIRPDKAITCNPDTPCASRTHRIANPNPQNDQNNVPRQAIWQFYASTAILYL